MMLRPDGFVVDAISERCNNEDTDEDHHRIVLNVVDEYENEHPEHQVSQHSTTTESEPMAMIDAVVSEVLSSFVSENSSQTQEIDQDEMGNNNTNNNTLVEAELVSPPVHAMSVVIDEESNMMSAEQNRNVSLWVSNRPNFHSYCDCSRQKNWKLMCIGALIASCLFGVIAAVFVVMIESDNGKDNGESESLPVRTYDYTCFRSTWELLFAQLDDFRRSNFQHTKDLYIICPGTHIKVGMIANPAKNDYNITLGEYPMVAITNDTTIQCGLDGRRENNCVLDGGFVQVMMLTDFIGLDLNGIQFDEYQHDRSLTVHNVTFRGFTFTGIIQTSGSLDGVSFLLSQPGNVTVDDCLWKEMTASSSVVYVGQNIYQELEAGGLEKVPAHSSVLTIRNSRFENIYYDLPMICSNDQSIHIENTVFSDITLSSIPDLRCNGMDVGCATIMACFFDSRCYLSDTCFYNVETLGPGLVTFQQGQNAAIPAWKAQTLNDELSEDRMGAVISTWNNYLDKQSSTSCEVVVLEGFDLNSSDIINDNGSLVCFDGLAFEAERCAL